MANGQFSGDREKRGSPVRQHIELEGCLCPQVHLSLKLLAIPCNRLKSNCQHKVHHGPIQSLGFIGGVLPECLMWDIQNIAISRLGC